MRFFMILFLLLSTFSLAEDTTGWFPFEATDFSGSVFAMPDWLDAPAGKHGYVQMAGDRFVFADGRPIKFWGVNICNARVAPSREQAETWPQLIADFGINAVRFHKFTWYGRRTGIGHEKISTQLDPEALDRFDYFVNELKKRGIYTGWSHIFGHRLLPSDSSRVLAYREIIDAQRPDYLDNSTYGLLMFAPDLQDLSIELTVNMLNHQNPYTGLRYADEPALAFVEMQNEDNIFFPATHEAILNCPTYKKLICEQFSEWLVKKYGDEKNFLAAWGEEAINAWPKFQEQESLAAKNIFPIAHCYYYSREALASPLGRRLLDTAEFLYDTQNNFYRRFEKAIRATGYQGPLVSTCWQAGSDVTHYYNLHSDALVGIIDRHNYFGGGTGHSLQPGKVNNTPMLSNPGSGLLGTGMQQVGDRPFVLSEWMTLIPNEWTAEAAPLIAIYGLGLQGWDGSYAFAMDRDHYTTTIQAGGGVYNATSPTHLAFYPTLARMLYRGDVTEGELISERYVHIPSLRDGNVGFSEEVSQQNDVKSFAGQVPGQTLAAGKTVVSFVENFQPTTTPDLAGLWDQANKVIRSNTGQLAWDYSDRGYFTVNTPGTQGVVGFANGKKLELGDLTLLTDTEFAVILVTSLEKEKSLAEAKRWLVTTVARARNTGMVFNEDKTELLQVGVAPILMEPVHVKLSLKDKRPATVNVLDHAGIRTGATIGAQGKNIALSGADARTIYYEILFD